MNENNKIIKRDFLEDKSNHATKKDATGHSQKSKYQLPLN